MATGNPKLPSYFFNILLQNARTKPQRTELQYNGFGTIFAPQQQKTFSMKIFLLAFAAITVTGCNLSTETKADVDNDSVVVMPESPAEPNTLQANLENCYRFVAQKDTYDIRLTKTGNNVNGSMHFNNYQKDDSRGSFNGSVLKDNIIKVIYKFESEGMKSTREIFLKDNGGELITGVGEEDVKGDSAFVKNPDAVQFSGPVYKKVDCGEMK